jgi:phosphoglycerol transferase MdoB-like AlkP superfamily enzyme
MRTERIKSLVPAYLKFLFWCFLIQLLVFLLYRSLHFFYNRPAFGELKNTGQAFLVGLQFDLSVLCYLCTPFFLVSSLAFLLNKNNLKLSFWFFWLSLLFVFLSQLVCAASIPYYKQFGNHLNQNAFLYAKEGKYVGALIIGDKGYWGFLLLFVVVYMTTVVFMNRLFRQFRQAPYFKYSGIQKAGILILSSALLFLGIRGRFSLKSPLHEGLALISDNNFTNSLAINPNYTFWKKAFDGGESYHKPENIALQMKFTQKYLHVNDSVKGIERLVPAHGEFRKYNVVVLIMESLCLFKMGYYNGVKTYPLLDSINKSSVFFSRFFSSGIHTFNGIFSSLSGFPSLLNEQPLRSYTGKSFDGLASQLKKQNYRCSFYTTHDKHFDNMAGFLTMNGFDEIIDDAEISAGKAINNLGVPDHVLYEEFFQRHAKPKVPFLAVLLSASDHGPWDVPKDIDFKPHADKKEENAAAYADWALFQFMQKAKKQSWYDSTVFVIVGDHGLSMGHTYQMPLSYHHIPCIIHCPALLQPDTVSFPAYQPDIGPTVLSVLNLPYTNSGFGQNAFEKPREFVWFSADDKLGAVTKEDLYYFEIINSGVRKLYRFPKLDARNLYPEKRGFADSLSENMHALFESANYLIRENQYSN